MDSPKHSEGRQPVALWKAALFWAVVTAALLPRHGMLALMARQTPLSEREAAAALINVIFAVGFNALVFGWLTTKLSEYTHPVFAGLGTLGLVGALLAVVLLSLSKAAKAPDSSVDKRTAQAPQSQPSNPTTEPPTDAFALIPDKKVCWRYLLGMECVPITDHVAANRERIRDLFDRSDFGLGKRGPTTVKSSSDATEVKALLRVGFVCARRSEADGTQKVLCSSEDDFFRLIAAEYLGRGVRP